MIEKNEMSKCMYMQLRLTISDFEKIPLSNWRGLK